MNKNSTKKAVILDRDGTLIRADEAIAGRVEGLFLGSSNDWRDKIEFLPGVIEGLKLLARNDVALYIATKQSGVALGGKFSLLTEERAHEVMKYIIRLLKKEGIVIRNYHLDPFVSSRYAREKEKMGIKVNKNYVRDDHDFSKPSEKVIDVLLGKGARFFKKDGLLGVIGDRAIDIQMAINFSSKSWAVLVPSLKTAKSDLIEVKEMIRKGLKVTIKNDFFQAAEWLLKKWQQQRSEK